MNNITSTTEKQLTPGWLNSVLNCKGQQGIFGKAFIEDGTIEETELDVKRNPIKGLRWKLKEDGTHDKYKFEMVAKKKEDSDEKT
jgi:hypothetical protein